MLSLYSSRTLSPSQRIQQMEDIDNHRSQLAAATRMTQSLREAISTQCAAAAAREDTCLLEILTPTQTAKFHDWVASNQERCQRIMDKRRTDPEKESSVWREQSLFEFCRRLDEVLRISKKEDEEMVQVEDHDPQQEQQQSQLN